MDTAKKETPMKAVPLTGTAAQIATLEAALSVARLRQGHKGSAQVDLAKICEWEAKLVSLKTA